MNVKATDQAPRTYAVCVYCKRRSTNRALFTIDPYFPQAGVTYRCADLTACGERSRSRDALLAERRQARRQAKVSAITDRAAEIGTKHGTNAASWVFNGNTSDETYSQIVKMADEGDPALYDQFRAPDLSGEYADDYSERQLAKDTGIDQDDDITLSDAAMAFNDAASEVFWSEVERIAREHVAAKAEQNKIDQLRRADFSIKYTDRLTDDETFIRPTRLYDYQLDGTVAYADLGRVARGEDYYDQTSTVDRSNYRSLMRDYPEFFTPISYTNVDSLGAFVSVLTDELVGILTGLVEQYPVYDESDLSELESEEVTESWDQYVSSDIRREMSETALDMWDELADDTQREMFWTAVEATDSYPEHDGHDVCWRYDAIVRHITEQLSS
jgi:hypothetical protein